MLEFLNYIDNEFFLLLNGAVHTPFLDHFMMLFTGRFIWGPMYAVILAILFWHFKRGQALVWIVGIILAVALTDQLCATVIRPWVGRLRPSNLENPISGLVYIVNGYRGGSYGFPSCHAANTAALASFLYMLIRRTRFRIFIISWAILSALSRLYLGVHYPGDLLVGAVIGTAIGLGCFRLSRASVSRIDSAVSKRHGRLVSLSLPRFQRLGSVSFAVSDIMIGVGAATTAVITVIAAAA